MRSAARGAAAAHSMPTSTGCTGSSVADARNPSGTVSALQLAARRRDATGGLVHRVGQRRPLPDPRPGQLVGQPRAGWRPASARWPTASPSRRSTSAEWRAASAAGRGCRARPSTPASAASTATACPGWASAHAVATAAPMDTPPTAIGRAAGGVVERVAVAVDEPLRLRRRRHDNRARHRAERRKTPGRRSRRRIRCRAAEPS